MKLTEKRNSKYVINLNGTFLGGDVANKLGAFEEAEETGLLKWLPCRVGDRVFVMTSDKVVECQVCSIEFTGEKTFLRVTSLSEATLMFVDAEDIGTKVFMTAEDAANTQQKIEK